MSEPIVAGRDPDRRFDASDRICSEAGIVAGNSPVKEFEISTSHTNVVRLAIDGGTLPLRAL